MARIPLALLPRRLAAAILLAGAIAAGEAVAQAPQPPAAGEDAARARELDALFAALKAAKDEGEGDVIVARIWQAWQKSGDPELDAKMEQAILVMGHAPALCLPILDELVEKRPRWAEAWNKRATALYLVGQHDRSLADIDRVLALEPRHFGALAGLGLIRMQRGEAREALAALRRALAVNPFLKERLHLIPELEKQLGKKPI